MAQFPPGSESDVPSNRARRPRPKPAKPINNRARLQVEDLEKRQLFNVNAFLPQRLAPIDGVSGYGPTNQLFRPVTTSLLPDLGLQSGSVTLTGSFVLTDTGLYSLSLQESGPDGAGSFAFSESGTLSFSLTEQGTFNAGGFSADSVVLTQNAFLSWSFLQTDGSGHTVQYLSGNTGLSTTSLGTAVLDPLFIAGMNWRDPTWQLSSLNALGLPSLSATSLTVQETNGSDSFALTESNGLLTLTGSGSQALLDSLDDTGQQSYSVTEQGTFTYVNSGRDTFTLSEAGSYAGGSFALSSVAYNEQGGDCFQLNETFVLSQNGTATDSGSQNFSGSNHSLADGNGDSYQFGELGTYSYGEGGSGSDSLYEAGTYGGGSFALGCLNFDEQGGGSFSLTDTAQQSQNGTFSDSNTSSGSDSFGVAGTITNADTVTDGGSDTATALDTVLESASANFTTTEQGAYGGGSFGIANFSLSESATGNVTVQVTDTLTEAGTGTTTDAGTGKDSFAQNYGAADTVTGLDSSAFSDTQTDSFGDTATDVGTRSGTSSYSLVEVGSAQGGSYSLSSYVFSSGISGNVNETATANDSSSGSGCATDSGIADSGNSDKAGGVSDSGLNNDTFQLGDLFGFRSTDSSTSIDSGSFSQGTYQAGGYANGSWAFGSVAYNDGGNDSTTLTDGASSTDSGSDSSTDSGNGQASGSFPLGADSFGGLGLDTFSNANAGSFANNSNDTITESGHDSFSFSKLGTYANGKYTFGNVVFQSLGTSLETAQDSQTDSFSGSQTDSNSASGNQSGADSTGIGTDSGLSSFADSNQDSFTDQGTDTVTDTVVASDSWNVYEVGSFTNGSWSLSCVAFGESASDTVSVQQNDSSTDCGTDTSSANDSSSGSGTTVYGGGSVTGLGTVSSNDSSSDSFTDRASDTLTESAQSSFSLSEFGAFSAGSFGFASLVYRGGDSISETVQQSSVDTSGGSARDTSSDQGQGNAAGSYAGLGSSTAFDSFLDSESAFFSTTGNDSFSESSALTEQGTFYEAGCFANGSYGLSSVSFGDTVIDSASFQALDTTTDSGTTSATDTITANGSDSLQGGGALESGIGTATATDTVTGSTSETATDSVTGSDSSSFTLAEQGSYANGSFAFSNWAYSGGDSVSETAIDASSDSFGGTVTDGGSSTDGGGSSGTLGYSSGLLSGSAVSSDSTSFVERLLDGSTDTIVSSSRDSTYEAGSFSFGSFSLSSVALSRSGQESWQDQGTGSSTDVSNDTVAVNGTFNLTGSTVYSGNSLSGTDSLSGSESFNGTDTNTNTDTTTDSGSESWSVTEQGAYGGDSYALGSVVFQDGESDSGTFQDTNTDTFVSSSGGRANDTTQGGSADSVGMDNASGLGSAVDSNNLQVGVQDQARDSLTDAGSSSHSLYEAGSFVGDSFGFASLAYQEAGSDSLTAYDSSTDNESYTLTGNSSGTDSGTDTGSYGCTTDASRQSDTQNVTGTFGADDTQAAGDTLTEQGSFSLTELGGYAADSFAFSSYAFGEGESLTDSSQETDSAGLSGSETGTVAGTNADTKTTVESSAGLLTVSDGGTLSVGRLFTLGLNATDTLAVSAGSTLRDSLYQAGSFAGDSFSFGSVVFSSSAGDSSTVHDNGTVAEGETAQVNDTQTVGDNGADTGDSTGNQDSASFTEQDTVTATDSLTDTSSFTETVYEAGSFAGGSYGLTSFALSDQSAETGSASDVTRDTSAETGSTSGSDVVDGYTAYNGTGTFVEGGGSTDTVTEGLTNSSTMSEQGGFGNGSFSLSNYLFSQQDASSVTDTGAGSSADTASGTNQGQGYSGPGGDSFSSSDVRSGSDSLTEQGSYANGSYSLGTVAYQDGGSDSFSDGRTGGDSWSGGYGGADSFSDQEMGNASYSDNATGSFSNGSFSLASYLLTGGASGSYADGNGNAGSLGSAGSSLGRVVSGLSSSTVYQSGSMTAGAFSNASYSLADGESDTTTDRMQGPGYNSTDTWTDGNTMQEAGSGTSGTETQTDGGTFTYCEGTDPADGNAEQKTVTVALPGVIVQPGSDFLQRNLDESGIKYQTVKLPNGKQLVQILDKDAEAKLLKAKGANISEGWIKSVVQAGLGNTGAVELGAGAAVLTPAEVPVVRLMALAPAQGFRKAWPVPGAGAAAPGAGAVDLRGSRLGPDLLADPLAPVAPRAARRAPPLAAVPSDAPPKGKGEVDPVLKSLGGALKGAIKSSEKMPMPGNVPAFVLSLVDEDNPFPWYANLGHLFPGGSQVLSCNEDSLGYQAQGKGELEAGARAVLSTYGRPVHLAWEVGSGESLDAKDLGRKLSGFERVVKGVEVAGYVLPALGSVKVVVPGLRIAQLAGEGGLGLRYLAVTAEAVSVSTEGAAVLAPGGQAIAMMARADVPGGDGGANGPGEGWKSSNTGDTGKNSALLRKNLGDAVKDGEDAHHLVQSTHPRAADGRAVLDKYQIDINAAENGVGLKPSGPRPAHRGQGLHSYEGIDAVTRRLQNATRGIRGWAKGRQAVIDELAAICARF